MTNITATIAVSAALVAALFLLLLSPALFAAVAFLITMFGVLNHENEI